MPNNSEEVRPDNSKTHTVDALLNLKRSGRAPKRSGRAPKPEGSPVEQNSGPVLKRYLNQ